MIILVASPSASGKTTLVNQAIDLFGLYRLITTTTRKQRPEETGSEYHFVTIDEFSVIKSTDGFVEFNEVYGNHYGLTKQEVETNTAKKCIAVLDVGGCATMKRLYGDDVKTVFILPPSVDELRQRLESRNINDDDENRRRLAAIDREVNESAWFDHVITSGELDKTIEQFNAVIGKIICPVFRG